MGTKIEAAPSMGTSHALRSPPFPSPLRREQCGQTLQSLLLHHHHHHDTTTGPTISTSTSRALLAFVSDLDNDSSALLLANHSFMSALAAVLAAARDAMAATGEGGGSEPGSIAPSARASGSQVEGAGGGASTGAVPPVSVSRLSVAVNWEVSEEMSTGTLGLDGGAGSKRTSISDVRLSSSGVTSGPGAAGAGSGGGSLYRTSSTMGSGSGRPSSSAVVALQVAGGAGGVAWTDASRQRCLQVCSMVTWSHMESASCT